MTFWACAPSINPGGAKSAPSDDFVYSKETGFLETGLIPGEDRKEQDET